MAAVSISEKTLLGMKIAHTALGSAIENAEDGELSPADFFDIVADAALAHGGGIAKILEAGK